MDPRLLALDSSERTYDKDGRLHIGLSHISKACVSPYLGLEIPGSAALGLDPRKIYKLLRSPDELKKGASTIARLPILSKHVPISSKDFDKDLIVGAIGSDVEFNDPFLDADLCFWTDTAIAGIETDTVRELSCAYRYVPLMNSGIYNGEHYDGIMTEIEGNHLAQVEAGRAGPEVMAADSKLEIPQMKMTKLGKALFVALGAASPKLAMDAAFPALVANADRKTFDKAAAKVELLKIDTAMDAAKCDAVMDALMDNDEPEPKEPKSKGAADADETEEEKEARLKKEKAAADKGAKDSEEKVEKAMDSFRKELREASDAKIAVRSVVGDVIAQDSAVDIYKFALDHLKVPHEGVTELAGVKQLFALAQTKNDTAPVRIALDAAPAVTMFPEINRFRQA